jgi:hypothetical protein
MHPMRQPTDTDPSLRVPPGRGGRAVDNNVARRGETIELAAKYILAAERNAPVPPLPELEVSLPTSTLTHMHTQG